LIDERLYLPASWIDAPQRCRAVGIPDEQIVFKSKAELALELIDHARSQGVRFRWIGFDGFYGSKPALLRALAEREQLFVGDVHKDQQIYLDDPKPRRPKPRSRGGRKPQRLHAQCPAIRIDRWAEQQPPDAWQRVRLRDATKGWLEVEVIHRRVWLWDGEEAQARHWHLIVRRELDQPDKLKYSVSNAPADIPVARLAFMQGQRYWVERALQDGKQEVGLGDYQARGWRAWHHHMALVMMAMLFMLEERQLNRHAHPLLSGTDIRALLNQFLPRRDASLEEVLRQMDQRHQKRQAAIDSAHRKQSLKQARKPDP
jgi:SRSO17 transposase